MKFELQTLSEYSEETLLAEMRRVAAAFSGPRLTRDAFIKLSRVHPSTLSNRFGSWGQALDRAGISVELAPRYRVFTRTEVVTAMREFASRNPGSTITAREFASSYGIHYSTLSRMGPWADVLAEVGLSPVALGRRYTDDECYENVLALWMHYGRQPSFAELKQPPSTVGPKAYVRRWGGWRAALAAFVDRANDPSVESGLDEAELVASTGAAQPTHAEIVSRSISLSLRYRVLVRDQFRCVACGASPAKNGAVELH